MKWLVLFFTTFCLLPSTAYAKYDPLAVPNNKVGIHILSEDDIDDAANLVNSNGDWGYVTLVIRDDERDVERWNRFFQELKKKHLIPLVRIATHIEGNSWAIPKKDDAYKWALFLNKLNWPIENRYIIVYNEPNHAKEWGGGVDPAGYAEVLNDTLNALRSKNRNFFILPAGLDLAAPNGPLTMDARKFILRMEKAIPGIFSKLDGWTSHSYPNPGFSASPFKIGKMGIRGSEWELNFLKHTLGIKKKLPVFITETGWVRSNWLTPQIVAEYYHTAFTQIWTDSQVVAVTPFLLNYEEPLFLRFSFKIPQAEAAYYPQYDVVQQLPKTNGHPLGTNKTPLGLLVDQIILRRYNSQNK